MSPDIIVFNDLPRGFPRVSGDEPLDNHLNDRGDEFSPRERG